MPTTPPWKRKNPARTHAKLSAKSVAAARARAKRAGRRYPNLVDNMHAAAAQKKAAAKTKTAKTPKTRAATRKKKT